MTIRYGVQYFDYSGECGRACVKMFDTFSKNGFDALVKDAMNGEVSILSVYSYDADSETDDIETVFEVWNLSK